MHENVKKIAALSKELSKKEKFLLAEIFCLSGLKTNPDGEYILHTRMYEQKDGSIGEEVDPEFNNGM